MALTGAQTRTLRALAHHLDPIVSVGKSDITDNVIHSADAALESRELIKCNVLDNSNLEVREAAEALAEAVNAEVVQVIGRRFVLYRVSQKKDFKHLL